VNLLYLVVHGVCTCVSWLCCRFAVAFFWVSYSAGRCAIADGRAG